MFSCEGIGKTIEKAIENALLELKASRDDVDIKILNEGGLFKKAKVLVTISEDAREKYQKIAKIKAEDELEEKQEKEIEKEIKKEIKEEEKQVKKAEKEVQKEIKKADKAEEKEILTEKEKVEPLEFLEGFFKAAGKEVEITTQEDEKYITYSVNGEDLGDMIGYRGESFYAISRLLTAICGRQEKKVLLDIGGYREKRAESLTILAKKVANKVIKTGRYSKLEPMNPSDRRIVHTALQDNDKVTTLSKGVEPHRYVIVFPKGSEEDY